MCRTWRQRDINVGSLVELSWKWAGVKEYWGMCRCKEGVRGNGRYIRANSSAAVHHPMGLLHYDSYVQKFRLVCCSNTCLLLVFVVRGGQVFVLGLFAEPLVAAYAILIFTAATLYNTQVHSNHNPSGQRGTARCLLGKESVYVRQRGGVRILSSRAFLTACRVIVKRTCSETRLSDKTTSMNSRLNKPYAPRWNRCT